MADATPPLAAVLTGCKVGRRNYNSCGSPCAPLPSLRGRAIRSFGFRGQESSMPIPVAILNLGPVEWVVIGVIALLLFGRRLPEMARSMGRGVVEFKRGLKGVEDDVDATDRSISSTEKPRVSPSVDD